MRIKYPIEDGNVLDRFNSLFRREISVHYLIVLTIFLTFTLASNVSANLITDGQFTNVTLNAGYTNSGTGNPNLSGTLYGEFGTGASGVAGTPTYPTSGTHTSTTPFLTVVGWNSTGYNFVYLPNTIDSGTATQTTSAGGLVGTGSLNQAPSEIGSNYTNGYGNTYMYGSNNGGNGAANGNLSNTGKSGTGTIETSPGGGNIVAMDPE
jgi:hypothetical protein